MSLRVQSPEKPPSSERDFAKARLAIQCWLEQLAGETAAVLRALRERDENTFAHCDRTCALSIETGRIFGLSSQDLAVLRWAAELHDIGKIGIPDSVLFKLDAWMTTNSA